MYLTSNLVWYYQTIATSQIQYVFISASSSSGYQIKHTAKLCRRIGLHSIWTQFILNFAKDHLKNYHNGKILYSEVRKHPESNHKHYHVNPRYIRHIFALHSAKMIVVKRYLNNLDLPKKTYSTIKIAQVTFPSDSNVVNSNLFQAYNKKKTRT